MKFRSAGGLIIGLGGLAAVVLVAIVIIAAQQMKPSEEPAAAAPTVQPTVTQVEPTATAAKEPAEEPEPEPAEEPEPEPDPKPSKKATDDKPAKSPGKTTSTPKTETPPAETSKPAASGGAACSQCVSDAQNGNFSGAVANHSACSGDAKARCTNTIRGRAAIAAGNAANNGDCAKAKQIIATVNQVGLGGPAQSKIAGKCP